MMLEERIARLNLERRAKIEARTNELHQEISPFGSLAKSRTSLKDKMNTLHGSQKTTQKKPKQLLDLAEERMKTLL
jgi:uncharacterized protein (DUF885 family)